MPDTEEYTEAQLERDRARADLIDRARCIRVLVGEGKLWADDPEVPRLWTALEVVGATLEGHVMDLLPAGGRTMTDEEAAEALVETRARRERARHFRGDDLPAHLAGLDGAAWFDAFDAVLGYINGNIDDGILALTREVDPFNPDWRTLDAMKGLSYAAERISGLRVALEAFYIRDDEGEDDAR